jgi:hypothetical protein
MRLKKLLAFVNLPICGASLMWLLIQPPSAAERIPELHAQSLAETKVDLPGGLKGKIGILILGFSKQASSQSRTWGDSITRDFGSDARVVYYQMPVLAEAPGFVRGFIVDSIRKSLPDSQRSHFVPILKDAAPWKSVAGFSGGDDAYLVLTDANGQVQWRTHGAPQAETYNELKKRIVALEASSPPA